MTSEAPRGYSHHPHIEKEWNNSRSKREHKERKNKLNSWSVYQEPHGKKGEWQKKKKKKEQIPNFVSGVGALSVEIRTGNCSKSITL